MLDRPSPTPAGLIASLCLDNPRIADEIRHRILSDRATLVLPPWSAPVQIIAAQEIRQ
ncbi:hypothetical protein ACHFJ0_04855 [Paracoccus sp. NGMCC 1.201697]|uniref:Uncharacterized protein n=1 Tax=Paracoccus broussonetiae subsp. drimophilus TaxID=3373869 RepID=A0ABW7LGU4_9RHOB